MARHRWALGMVIGIVAWIPAGAVGQEKGMHPGQEKDAARAEWPRIRDNLFVLEEAYNQEPGVAQHILVFRLDPKSRGWTLSFTDEWPVPTDRNQVSLSLNLARDPGVEEVGLSEVLVNWRYQAVGLGGTGPVALAPRLSLVIPTGSLARGGSRGVLGVQGNLPLSIEAGRWMVIHLNAGLAVTPGAMGAGVRKTLWEPSAGVALVGQPLPWFNLMVEGLFASTEEADQGRWRREQRVTVSPGVRFAIDHRESGLQVVPGVAASLDFLVRRDFRAGRDLAVGIIAYLSFEHPAFQVD